MSKEAWGDEGDVPTDFKDTAMWQEFTEIDARWQKWMREYKDSFPNDECRTRAETVEQALEELCTCMEEIEL